MSSGAYDAPLSSSPFVPNDTWRPSSLIPSIHDRSHHPPPRRRSPTPPRRYSSYSRYIPPGITPTYREDFPNVYRPAPNNYRPDESNVYFSRSPSPDRYIPPRISDADAWDRSSSWVPPIKTTWQDRKLLPPSPTTSMSRNRPRGDSMLATRMFEPSDAWKHNHDRFSGSDILRASPIDRYPDHRMESFIPIERLDHSPVFYPDSYHPPHYDSYRPSSWTPSSPVNSRSRDTPRSTGRYNFNGRRASGSGSKTGSISPRSHRRSPAYRTGRRSRSRGIIPSSRGRRSVSRGLSRSPRRRSSSRSISRRRSISRGRRSISSNRRSISRGRRSVSSRRRSSDRSPRSSYVRDRTDGDPLPRHASNRESLLPSKAVGSSRRSVSRSSPPSRPNILVTNLNENPKKGRARSLSSIASTQASEEAPSPVHDNAPPLPESVVPTVPKQSEAVDLESDTRTFPSVKVDPPYPTDKDDSHKDGATNCAIPSTQTTLKSELALDPTNAVDRAPLMQPQSLPGHDQSQMPPVNGSEENTGTLQREIQISGTQVPKTLETPPDTSGLLSTDISQSDTSPSLPLSDVPPVSHSPSSNHQATNDAPTRSSQQDPESDVLSKAAESIVHITNSAAKSLPTPQPTPRPIMQPSNSIPDRETLPKLSDAKSTAEALRYVVMARLLNDRQSREERVNPVLMANLSIAEESRNVESASTSFDVLSEVTTGTRSNERMETFSLIRGSLVERFNERRDFLTEKTQRLREQYISLHERWVAHCASLDEQTKPIVLPEPPEPAQPSGRTTRRSTANLGDAVRSDLEMEQIIASLGIDEATDPNQLSARNLAVIPDMISVAHGKVDYVFDDTNHLVENPSEYYGPHTGLHDWTEEEKEIFLDKFAAHPKQFGVIAEHIPNKTAAQCVDYYYLHKKKLIDFRKVISLYAPKRRRRGMGKSKGNGLLADIRQHDAEVHGDADSPSVSGRTTRGRRNMPPPEPKKPAARRMTAQLEATPGSTPTPEPDTRPRRRRMAASATAPPSRTVSVNPEEGEEETDVDRPNKRAKRSRKVKSAAIVTEEPANPAPETKPSDQGETSRKKSQPVNAQWSDEDKSLFLGLLAQHGADFKRIAASMPNKTTIQVTTYYKANLVELDLEKVAISAPRRSPTPEAREIRKDLPYPGSGIMSIVLGTPQDPSPPMSSLRDDTTPDNNNLPIPLVKSHEMIGPSNGTDIKQHPTWATPSTPLPSSSASARNTEPISNSVRPLSPSQVRAYSSPVGYHSMNLNGRLSSSNYGQVPVYPPVSTVPYIYPQYNDSHYSYPGTRAMQRHSTAHPLSDPHTAPNHRTNAVLPLGRGENPYPVLPGPGAPPASYHYSLESS